MNFVNDSGSIHAKRFSNILFPSSILEDLPMRFIWIGFIAFLSGCAIVPENIQIADENQLVTYEQVLATGDGALTKPARWGGLIANVENLESGSVVEVVSFPLNHYGKPSVGGESVGRFKVKMSDFLDPIVFESGRVITFTGVVDKPLEGVIGEQNYVYPTLQGNSFHLWRKETVYNVTNLSVGFGGFHSGFYGPRFGGRYYGGNRYGHGVRSGHGRSRVRVVESAPSASPRSTRASSRPYQGRRSNQSDRIEK